MDIHLIELLPESEPGKFHRHPTTENIYFLLAGAIELRHEEGALRLRAGDAARVPPGVAHSATAIGKRGATILEIYCPAPADFELVEPGDTSAGRS